MSYFRSFSLGVALRRVYAGFSATRSSGGFIFKVTIHIIVLCFICCFYVVGVSFYEMFTARCREGENVRVRTDT